MNIQEKKERINDSLPKIRGYISKPKADMSQEDINILKLVLLFSDTINNSETKRKEQAINMVYSIVKPTMVVVCEDISFTSNNSISDDQTGADQLNILFWKLNAARQDLGFTSSKVIELIKKEINKIREPIGLFSIKTSGSNLKKACNEIIEKVEPYIENEDQLTKKLDEIYNSESNLFVVRSKLLKNANKSPS